MKKLVAAALAVGVIVLGLVMAPQAMAQGATGPDSKACADAKTALGAALALVVQFNPNVYPNDKVPAVGDVTPALLQAILLDNDLGGGARAEVEAALKAFTARDTACAVPPTTTVTVTPTVTPPAPPLFADCAAVRAAGLAPLGRNEAGYRRALDFDGDGQACEAIEGRRPVVIDTGVG